MKQDMLIEKYCGMCSKPMFPTLAWVYKLKDVTMGTRYYCSYSCYKKAKEELNEIKTKNRKRFSWKYGAC